MSDFGGRGQIHQFTTDERSALDPFVYRLLYFLGFVGLAQVMAVF